MPGHEELAMGAIAMGGGLVLNEEIVKDLNVSQDAIKRIKEEETNELARRILVYRGNKPFPEIKDKIIISVDDGIATGATITAAIQSLRQLRPKKLIIAVPVADVSIHEKISVLVDDMICPLRPLYLYAVGAWYDNFAQTTDEEVRNLLKEANKSYDTISRRH